MNIQIPESALEPFGVLGIPKLCNISLEGINDILEAAFESMNLFGTHITKKPFPLSLIKGYILDCLRDIGVDVKSVKIFTVVSDTECDITIYHSSEDIHDIRRYRLHRGTVVSDTGFR